MYLTTDTRWLLQETRTGLPAVLVGQVTRLTKVTLHDLGIERTVRTWQEKNIQILILYSLCTENAPKMILSFTDFNVKIKISTRLYSRVLILIFKLKSVNDNTNDCTSTGSSTLPTRNFQKYLTSTLSF